MQEHRGCAPLAAKFIADVKPPNFVSISMPAVFTRYEPDWMSSDWPAISSAMMSPGNTGANVTSPPLAAAVNV